MALSRRQFFRSLMPGDPNSPQRLARYQSLETYVRTQLLPYDFELTEAQERELMAEVRAILEKTSNDNLFAHHIRGQLEQLVEAKIQPWRSQSDIEALAERIREIRQAAPDYVTTFLEIHAGTPVIEQLKQMYGIYDLPELEKSLKRQVEIWISETNDRLLSHYDVVSVQDLVFAQLRSWC